MHAFNVLLQSSPRVALQKEPDRNKAAIGVFCFFFLSEFYQNADGTREPEKEILFKVCSSRPSRRSLDYIRAHKKYQHRAVKLLECFVLFELRRHY